MTTPEEISRAVKDIAEEARDSILKSHGISLANALRGCSLLDIVEQACKVNTGLDDVIGWGKVSEETALRATKLKRNVEDAILNTVASCVVSALGRKP